jgi:hypothetical protein
MSNRVKKICQNDRIKVLEVGDHNGAGTRPKPAPIHIQVSTGQSREGASPCVTVKSMMTLAADPLCDGSPHHK